ncbi:MAG: SH3 domain-containing protein [Dinoroseobacter sp.]|nr:SH3 domain-containing protein [Dinoroseobacter sp.]MDJ0991998.1 SH3 domain-containing protein [Dinoroseobacter sp.]
MQATRGFLPAFVLSFSLVLGLAMRPAIAEPKPEPRPEQPELAQVQQTGPVTNLPLPRFVSMKAQEGNVRRGPSLTHRIDWVFTHRDMPLKIVGEYGHWRRVVDREGAGGWMHYALLSGVRTVIVEVDLSPIHAKPTANSPVRARAEAGAIVRLDSCTGNWCRVRGGRDRGWIEASSLWGLDSDLTTAPTLTTAAR